MFNQLVSLKKVVLVQAEALVIVSCFIVAAKLWLWNGNSGPAMHTTWTLLFAQCSIQVVLLQAGFYYGGLYNIRNDGRNTFQFWRLLGAIGILWLVSTALGFGIRTL